jgi:hypothetical protein
MHEYLGWKINIQLAGIKRYTFQVAGKIEHYRCPRIFRSWDEAYAAAHEWVDMHIARITAIDLLDVLWEDGRMTHQEHDALVRDLQHDRD